MEKRKSKFKLFIILAVSAVIIYVIYYYLFNYSGKINQGNFRINDFVVESKADVTDGQTSSENKTDLSGIVLNVSQKNIITLLISQNSNVEVSSIYLDNIKVTKPQKVGNLIIYQSDQNQQYNLSEDIENIPINLIKTADNQYNISLCIDNNDILKNTSVPENITSLAYDGTIFNLFNIKLEDLSLTLQFDLNIEENTGKIDKCTIKLNLPDEKLLSSGISVEREDISNFNFVIKSKKSIEK